MNKLETIVYNAVRKNPALKQFIRNCYQSIFDLLPRKKEFFSCKPDFKEGYFFGFHDVSPLSEDGSKLLAMRPTFDLRMPKPYEPIEIGFFEFKDGKLGNWTMVSKSYAWNYHKGCRLQWLDNNHLIFNSAINDQLCCVIVDVTTGSQNIVKHPIDALFKDSELEIATSFSYERLERCMPGYGYPYSDDSYLQESAPDKTGLFLLNLKTGERKLLLNLKQIALAVNGNVETEYYHFVTHTEFSKDGHYISFLYRRIPREGDYMKRKSVVCVYDLKNGKLIILPTQESGSHYVWNDKNQIIASVTLNGNNCHALFDLNNIGEVKMVDSEYLNSDGHQSFITDDEFVTDTYPDKWRMAKLYRSDISKGKSTLIASIYSPKKFQTKDFHCHIACYLHPRVIGNGKYVCFDSPRSGTRSIYIMKLK